MRRVAGRFDVVVTTNGGHPLDRNLYQAVKGMAAAERVVADGGTVLLAAACGDGVPADGAFARLLADARRARRPGRPAAGRSEPDRWQAQVMGRVLRRAAGLAAHRRADRRRGARGALWPGGRPVRRRVAEALASRRSGGTRCCVLPQGPLTVAGPTELRQAQRRSGA